MCGICGIFSKERTPADPFIAMMNDFQQLRGPDGRGHSTVPAGDYTCSLGHTRLAIIDRAGGGQPMTAPESGVSLVCNGEIYNHRQLRLDLEKTGCVFRSRSDTEVLLHGYHAWGLEQLLQRIDGMFAFAIADPRQRQIILARDPAGQKPLYYTEEKGKSLFAFASTLQALTSLPWFDRQIDSEAVELFLNLRVIPAPYSIYRRTRKLPPGSYLVHDGKTTTVREYWSPFSIPVQNQDRPESALLEEYRDILSSSLAETLIADEPVALLLSSGVDSASLARELSLLPEREKVTAFTVSFPAKSYDEARTAAAIAKQLALNHQLLSFDGDSFQAQVETLAGIIDEPFGDAGILPALQLSAAVAKNSRVAITGDGADELFGGYPTFNILPYWSFIRRFPGFFRLAGNAVQRVIPPAEKTYSLAAKIKRLSQGLGHPDMMAFARWLCVFTPEETTLLMEQGNSDLFQEFVSSRLSGIKEEDPVSMMCRSYFRLFLPGVLEKMDRAAMHYSLETRAPFLQRRMMEFAFSLPPEFKVHNRNSKYLLRKSLAGDLPQQIAYADKKGFLPPIGREFAGNWGAGIAAILTDACDSFGIDRQRVMALLTDHRTLRRDHSQQLWLIYQLGLFQQNCRKNANTAHSSSLLPPALTAGEPAK